MNQTKLVKTLGLTDVFCIAAGAMISSGIFILPGIAFSQIGPAMFLAYLLAGICALAGALATIELATAMPLAGGIYYYTGRSLGPLAGTVSGLLNWSAISLKSAFAIVGMAAVLKEFFGFDPMLSGILITLFFLVVNLIGTKEAAWAQIVMVILLFAAMGAYIVLGAPELKLARFTPFFRGDNSWPALFSEAAFVFVAFGGLLDVASVSEEVKNPSRNLPLGMIGAIIAVAVVYVLTLIVTVGAMDPGKLSGSMTPLADAARQYYGRIGSGVITFGAMMAFVTTANAGVMAAARFPYAMGRDDLIPKFFARVCGKRRMPLPALLLTGGTMVLLQLIPLEKLVTVASTVIMLSFILTNLSVIILRESDIQNYRPTFRVPFYPVLPLLSMAVFALLIMELGLGSVKISFAVVIAGVLLYFLFGRKVNLEYALTHLLCRITRRRMPKRALESELREIIRARDGIVEDEFDRIVNSARIAVDVKSKNFRELARTHEPALAHQLIEREAVSPTAITSNVAIPHLTVPGKKHFDLLIVKSPEGIRFSEKCPAVHAVFFLFGTEDMRNLHLRALAAIAQIIQSPGFDGAWKKASGPEALRDLLLLARRKR